MARDVLGLDIGSNSVGSMWFDQRSGALTTGTSIFPAGVDETDDKRGDPKNAKRRMTRRTRITLRRRAERKRQLRLRLIAAGLLPESAEEFKTLLEQTDPWALRREGLDKPLTPHQFGRVLLHLAQRRGALGLKIADVEEGEEADPGNDGKVKAAIGAVRERMLKAKARAFGEFIAMERDKRVHPLTGDDNRPKDERKGPRQYRDAVRNKAGNYEHCADRAMIRDEFRLLWDAQTRMNGPTAKLLTHSLRVALDDPKREVMDNDPAKTKEERERYKSTFREGGLLFEQRFAKWDEGTLGRCVLEPTERCAPHADMHASRYLVVETVNNLRIIERGVKRALSGDERARIKDYLSGPLGIHTKGKAKGKPKTTVTPADLRAKMVDWYGEAKWTKTKNLSPCRFVNEDADEKKDINTDWFSREIVHGAIGADVWPTMPESLREGINKAILKHDPEQDGEADALRAGVMKWAGLSQKQADALVAAWARRPKIDAKRLTMSRKAVRNLLTVMDRPDPWPKPKDPASYRWLTQIEARKMLAADADFRDVTTGKPMDDHTRRRYATGAKGATARDRHYMGKHVLMKNGKPIIGPDGHPLAEPPPAPIISNPVVRKAIHEVRRHVVEYMTTFGRKPDEIYIELAREARMGAKDSDRVLFKNRLRNRIRNDIIECFELHSRTPTQQRAAVDRVVLCVQQGGVCPLCGNQKIKTRITPKMAAQGDECDVAHIIPRGSGGHNGLSNIVLSHRKCNRDMGRRTPREFWNATLQGGFEEGFRWIEGIFGDVKRPKPAEVKKAEGDALWACYFDYREDKRKIEQFAKDVKDIQEMTNRQEAATKYAARQVMAYLADALFDGKGLPERAMGSGNPEDDRRIFATDGLWTSRLRREWGLFFDPHSAKAKGLSNEEEHQRKEKNRGDHRHHAIDAIVIGLCTRSVQMAWDAREKAADAAGINTADEEQMENYRRLHPLDPPAPFKTREAFREAVRVAVFGDENNPRPICHRPVKRKLIDAIHKATQYGPVVDRWVQNGRLHERPVDGRVTIRQAVLGQDQTDFLKPAHLRVPKRETEEEAVARIARRLRIGKRGLDEETALKDAMRIVRSPAFTFAFADPKPEKGGIVRDPALKRLLRELITERGLNPDKYTRADLKNSIAEKGPLRHRSGVPINSVKLLRSNSEPVKYPRAEYDYATGEKRANGSPGSARFYDGQNNHHVEIRASVNKRGQTEWSGRVVSAAKASRVKLDKLKAFRQAGVPKPEAFRARKPDGTPAMSDSERSRWRPIIAGIEAANPIVDRGMTPTVSSSCPCARARPSLDADGSPRAARPRVLPSESRRSGSSLR